MATLEEQVAELARQLAELRGASAVAPSVATVSTERSTLEVRPVMKEVLALVGDLQTETDEPTTRLTGSRKAPEQPKFHGKNFPLFLSRHRRWSLLSGIDRADDDTKRV